MQPLRVWFPPRPWARSWVSIAAVALVAGAVVVVVVGVALVADGGGHPPSVERAPVRVSSGRGPHRVSPAAWAAAVDRTLAAGSAHLDATYLPPSGPPVTITGRTSFAGPEAEVAAAAGDGPAAHVRVTATGAWLRAPGQDEWSPISLAQVSGAAAARGWADLLRTLRPTDDVWADDAGRIVRVRREGFDVRFSAFGTDVDPEPP